MSDNARVFAPSLIGSSGETLREAFGKALTNVAANYPALVVLDADVAGGTGMHHFRRAHPDRFIQLGIAEQNMVGVAAGMALAGALPVASTFAVFALRTIEQVRQSIAYPRLNVKLAASHPGLDAGPDGASAQALEDLAAFRAIPGMTVVSPADAIEMSKAVPAILDFNGPLYLRTGRSPARQIFDDSYVFQLGKGRVVREGGDVTIVACGVEVARALDAAELLKRDGLDARVVNMSTIKPIDEALLVVCARETGAFVTAEDHNIVGGLGGAVAEALARTTPAPIEFIGVRDVFGESGEPEELAEKFGLTGRSIAEAARRAIARKPKGLR
jgi:transketolase